MSRKPVAAIATAPRVVRLAHPFGLCQLFRPLAKDSKPRPVLNEQFEYAGVTLRFSAREAMGAPEQTLLLALLEIAQEQHRRRPAEHMLDETDHSEVGALLWSGLHVGSAAPLVDAPSTLKLHCSWSELHRRCGGKSVGGQVTESRRQSLMRLCEVTVWERVESTRKVRSCRLVSWLLGDDQRVHVALNHRLAAALLAPSYAQVLMSERLSLPSQTAMLVHAFLSTCLGVGKTMAIGHETLVARLWPLGSGLTPASTQRRRLSDVRAALRSIGRLQRWRVELGATVATVTRTLSKPGADCVAPQESLAPTSASRPAAEPRARDMTRTGHFVVSDASFGEQPFWKKLNAQKYLPRKDEGRTTS